MKYLVEETSDHPSAGDLAAKYKQGWILVSVTSLYHPTYNSPNRRFWSTYMYKGANTARNV